MLPDVMQREHQHEMVAELAQDNLTFRGSLKV